MNKNNFIMIGIDISKDTLDICTDGKKVNRHENRDNGFKEIINALPQNSWCVMESTSTYGYRLADYLVKHGIIVSVVNPLSVKRFAQMNLSRTKTDKADARLIAEYAKIAELPIYKPKSDAMNDLQQLQTVIVQLIKQRSALKNQLEALQQMPRPSIPAIKAIEAMKNALEQQIKSIEEQMHLTAQLDCLDAYEKALSVKGIGKRTATLLIAITRGFSIFENARKLSAYIGVCPRIIQSGTSVKGKTHICKMGLANVRATLYMCSHSACKYNNACRALYQRLIAKGKAKKVALMAVVNKLIHQVFACVSRNEYFDNNFNISLAF